MHINYAEVRATPIESVILHYGWEYRHQDNVIVLKHCPLPSHTSKELYTFKAGIQENLWRCWSKSCRKGKKDGGDVIDLVSEVDGTKPLEAAKKLAALASKPITIPKARKTEKPVGINKPLGFQLAANPVHPMIQERGISAETARLYGAGFYRSKQGTASMDNRIIFPLHENGVLVGYCGRTTLPETPDNPKWKVGNGLHKTMLFGLDRCDPAKALVVCESPWEVLLAHQIGRHAAALLGSSMSKEQENLLEPYGLIWVMMDHDEAGKAASEEICSRLEKRHRVIRSFLKD